MNSNYCVLAKMSDRELLDALERAVANERHATVALIAALGEFGGRKLYLEQGYPSLFAYCTRALHLSEAEAYFRIKAARAARRFPLILERLAEGALTLTAVRLLAPHLTTENHREVLDAARHQKKEKIQEIAAALEPKKDVRPSLRKLPARGGSSTSWAAVANDLPRRSTSDVSAVSTSANQPSPASTVRRDNLAAPTSATTDRITPAPSPLLERDLGAVDATAVATDLASQATATNRVVVEHRAVVEPLAPERYKLQMTISGETRAKLQRVQDLLRHKIPDGDLAAVFEEALTILLDRLERTKAGTTLRPRPSQPANDTSTRHIPAAIRREVWKRDGGRCTFVGKHGRCEERAFLEYHHIEPFADGGKTTADNITLHCAAHNLHQATKRFGSLSHG